MRAKNSNNSSKDTPVREVLIREDKLCVRESKPCCGSR